MTDVDGTQTGRIGPMAGPRFDALVAQWARHGTIVVAGRRGSGRRTTADALLETRPAAFDVWRTDASTVPAGRSFGMLESLGLLQDPSTATTPETVARAVLTHVRVGTIIVEHADLSDAASLRTLALLARKTRGIRVIVTVDIAKVEIEGLQDVHGMPIATLMPLDRDATMDLIERMVGARPTFVDAHLVHRGAAGSFRTIRWLVELARLHGGVSFDQSRARVQLPRLAAVRALPAWALEPTLVDDPAAKLLAMLGALPVAGLEHLGIVERCASLEQAGVMRVADGEVRFVEEAIAYDVATRAGFIERRRLVQHLLRTLSEDEVGQRAATALWDRCAEVGLEAPPWAAAAAAATASRAGRHAEALVIAAESPEAAVSIPDLVLSSVMLDAHEDVARLLADPSIAETETAEGVAIALLVAEVRHGDDSVYTARLDDVLARLAPNPASVAVVRACLTLMRGGERMDEEAVDAIATDATVALHTRARATRTLALRAWMAGRPIAAGALADEADALDRGASADAGISVFLRVGSEMLRPDHDACIERLLEGVEPDDASRLRSLLAATLGFSSGAIPVARMHLQRLTAGGSIYDRALESLTLPMLALAHSMLSDDEAADDALGAAADASLGSLFLQATAAHVRGIAVMHLAEPDRDEGLACFAAAADAATELDCRMIEAFTAYRRAMALDESQSSATLQALAALRAGDRPLDGLPGMLADLADAFERRDVHRVLDIANALHRAGAIQDAKIIAMRLMSSAIITLPARMQRTISKLARIRFDTGRAADGPQLTPRERDVARLVLLHKTDRQIADELGLSPRTASVHVGRILRKLGLSSRHDLTVDLARRSGVADAGIGEAP